MTEGDLSFSPTAFIISHHLLKMHQTFAFGNPPLLSQLLLFFFFFFLPRFYQRVAFDIRPWAEIKKRHIIPSGLFPVTHETHLFVNADDAHVCQPDKLECLNWWWACLCPAVSGNRNLALKPAAKQERENGSVVFVYVVLGRITSPQVRVLGSAGCLATDHP